MLPRHWALMVSLAAGTLVPAVSGFLVFFKASIHGHGPPAISPEDLAAFLRRSPIWALGGAMLAGGLSLAAKSASEERPLDGSGKQRGRRLQCYASE